MRSTASFGAALLTVILLLDSTSLAQSRSQSASQRLRPLGAPSAVDQFRSNDPNVSFRGLRASAAATPPPRNVTAGWQSNATNAPPVRQMVMMQEMTLPLGAGAPAPNVTSPQPPAATSRETLPGSAPVRFGEAPNAAAPIAGGNANRALPPSPTSNIASPSDFAPMAQPTLPGQGFATIDNCNLITAQSNYLAAGGYGCGNVLPTAYAGQTAAPVTAPFGTAAPTALPAQIPSAATLPPTSVFPSSATAAIGGAAPARALVSLGQESYPVQVGQGLWGQPVAYVPGQSVRNWLRYISP